VPLGQNRLLIGLDPIANLHNHEAPQASDASAATSSSSEDVTIPWGERDAGGPVNQRLAMEELQDMRRELSNLSRARSASTHRTDKASKFGRIQSRFSIGRSKTNKSQPDAQDAADLEKDIALETSGESTENDFELAKFLKDGHFEKRTEDGASAKKVGVVFKNLTVKGVASKATFAKTLPDAIIGTFGPDLYKLLCRFIPQLSFGRQGELRDLIKDFTGVVRDGQMMLVLGRPGSGCTTFLKTIANERSTYADVQGEVLYGGITAEEQYKHYRGEVIYNEENDRHLPNLNVFQTLYFSLLNKTKKRDRHEINIIIDALLKMFAITHTRQTLVGNEYVRGVSGGERKRVSIAETLATKSTLLCWDNATRGLDASTALDYANSLRIMTDASNRTTITTLYQAGEEIYNLFDKVLVIEEGRMIYQGPIGEARQYFKDLGFHASERQTTPDFLTSVGDPTERQIREGYEGRVPRTAEDLEKAFKSSEAYQKILTEVGNYEKYLKETNYADSKGFKQSVKEQKSKRVTQKSSYTVSFWRQVMACTRREFWLIWGDKPSLYTKYFIIVSCALIIGSLFYNQPDTTAGAFSRGGTCFMSVLFLGWLQLTELMKAISGREIIARHKEYAFYRPSAVVIARAVTDFPVLLPQAIVFGVIVYFMTGLVREASNFFIYLLFVYTTTLTVTAFYRMMAALSPTIDDAVRFAGIGFNVMVIFTGYAIPKPQLLMDKIWFGWLYYISPVTYSFEGALTNELSGRQMQCASNSLVPQGPGIQAGHQGCAISGASLDSTVVSGDQYLATSFQYSRANLWRNWAVVVAFGVLYLLITAVATEIFSFTSGGGGALIFKKSKKAKKQVQLTVSDEEKGEKSADNQNLSIQPTKTQDEVLAELSKSESVFTWSDVSYTVPVPGGEKRLLNNISGYAKPGVMVALMGASGAGKTTLLNTLSQRQKVGVVSGDMLVDGRPLNSDFQRSTGFVEQMDLHDETATVREALEFSALLRQEGSIPRQEKLDYVDKIVDLLELHEIEDALISSLGVEQKKRLTIGVELAAKPSLLLFLDEPTSGLDANAAFSIVRFLKKLCAAGQAIICTIHQPSSMLIQQFDMILALNPGGNTFYFGPVGNDGEAVVKYFADRGVHCPPHKNVAEFILETAIKGGKRSDGKRLNWNKEWRESKENAEMLAEIERIKSERSQVALKDTTIRREFAASTYTQTKLLTTRMFTQHWRDPSYLYGKLFTSVIIGIFVGFTFWDLGNTIIELQDRLFACFLIIIIPPTIVNGVVPKFYQNRGLWEAREHPSRIYGWFAFCTANVLSEIPAAIIGGVVYYLLFYFPSGLPTDAPTAGYVFLMTILFFLFMASWGQWICAFAPSFTVISNVLPFFFLTFAMFNGVIVPYEQLNVFWRYWMYYVNPSQWWISGVLSATLVNIPVQCAPSEAAYFSPPNGQTCVQYAGQFVNQTTTGYLLNPNDNSNCGYCQYSNSVDYLASLNISPSDKWRDFGIFLVFVFSNWA
jgi:ATP-binding cassette, subfamily G (WHITE), member 2, SNQ2